jgi:regulatory protein
MPAISTQIDTEFEVKSIEADVPAFRRAAVNFLARREHSHYELQQKLTLKFPDAAVTVLLSVIDRLKRENLQSDERFVEAYIRYRKSRGFGIRHIHHDLRTRRVDDLILDRHLFESDEDWNEIALRLVAKKLGSTGKINLADSTHQRIARFLESRGFQAGHIKIALGPRLKF